MKGILQVFTAVIPMITAMSNTFFLNTKIYHYQNKYQQNNQVYKQENKKTLQNKGQVPNQVANNFTKKKSFNSKNTNSTEGRHPFVNPFIYFYKKSVPWGDEDDNKDIFFQAQNGSIYVATDKYVYYSTDGINFNVIKSINNYKGIPQIMQAQNGIIYVALQTGDLYYSTDGINFILATQFDGGINQIFQSKKGDIFVCTDNGIFRKIKGWEAFDKLKGVGYDANHIFEAQNGTIYVVGHNSIVGSNYTYYFSTDGLNFNKVSGLPISGELSGNLIFESQNSTIYIGISYKNNVKDSGFYRSVNSAGTQFAKIASIPSGPSDISNIVNVFCVTQNGDIYVGAGSHGLYMSTDGKNFNLISTIPTSVITQIFQARNGEVYIATNNHGLYYSKKGTTFNKVPLITGCNKILEGQNGVIYFTTLEGLFFSNQYANFSQVQDISSDSDVVNLFQAKNGTIYANTQIFPTPYTESTYSLFINPPSTFFNHMSINSNVNYYWQTNNQDIYYEVRKNTVTFSFDKTWVSSATVSIDDKTPLSINPKQKYTLTNNTHDAEIATLTISNTQKTSIVYHFILDKAGASTLTFNKTNAKDSRGDDEYALNLYINGYQAQILNHDIAHVSSRYYGSPVLSVLINKIDMLNNPWNNIFNKNSSLESTINNDGEIISSIIKKNLYDALTTGNNSVLNFDAPPYGQYDKYRANLDKNIHQSNYLQDPNNPKDPNGIILYFIISTDSGVWYIDNFDETDYNQAYNNIVLGQI